MGGGWQGLLYIFVEHRAFRREVLNTLFWYAMVILRRNICDGTENLDCICGH